MKQITLMRGDTAEDDCVELALLRSAAQKTRLAVMAKLQGLDGVRGATL